MERVRVTTFRDWAAEQRRRLFPRLPSQARSDTPAVVQRLKLEPALLEAVERQVARVPGERSTGQVLDDWMSVLTQRRLLGEVFAERAPDAFTPRELDFAVDWCRARNEDLTAYQSFEPLIMLTRRTIRRTVLRIRALLGWGTDGSERL